MAKKSAKKGAKSGWFNLRWQQWAVIVMWAITVIGITAVATLFILAKEGRLGPMPSFEELENPKTNLATEVYSADGKLLGNYFIENRTYLAYEDLFPEDRSKWLTLDGHQLPPVVAALLATEDSRFFDHSGIDFTATARAGIKTILMSQSEQGGGSTITQQLAKNLYKTRASHKGSKGKSGTIAAKAQEYVIATQLEYNYTKEEIVSMYLNTVEFSNNNFGIKSAANNFFGKEPRDLNIEEAAVIVGQVKAPTTYAPLRGGKPNPKAKERRNLVLSRMAEAGMISQEEAHRLQQTDIELSFRRAADAHNEGSATYFREMVRRTLMAKEPVRASYASNYEYEMALKEYHENPAIGWCVKNGYDIYRDGLKIYTSLDSRMQQFAEEAMQEHMSEVVQPRFMEQMNRRSNKSIYVDLSDKEIERKINSAIRQSERWRVMKSDGYDEETIYASFDQPIRMEVFTYDGIRDTVMTPRDSLIHHKSIMRGAFVAMDPHTGYVKAYVGGPNYRFFKFDAATQGKRQVGSTAKPFIYSFAIEQLQYEPCHPVPNRPVSIETPAGIWSPRESNKVEYVGTHPLYWGLANSRNNYSAWIMKQVLDPQTMVDYIHNIGIKSHIEPVPALCLGSYESNVFEMTSVYTSYANQGIRVDPIFITRIEDNQGNILAEFDSKTKDVFSEDVAYTIVTMMQRVVSMGTARRMLYEFKFNDVEMAAKTGTTNDNVDTWFMCVLPNLVMGSWVGGDESDIHLTSSADGSRLALPIAGKFLTKIYDDGTFGIERSDKFIPSANVPDYSCPIEMEDTTGSSTYYDDGSDDFFN